MRFGVGVELEFHRIFEGLLGRCHTLGAAMEPGVYDAVSSSTSDVLGSESWVFNFGSFVLFLAVIYLM